VNPHLMYIWCNIYLFIYTTADQAKFAVYTKILQDLSPSDWHRTHDHAATVAGPGNSHRLVMLQVSFELVLTCEMYLRR
jgi:hypothetical protein